MNMQAFGFQVWDAAEPGEVARWIDAWQVWPRREVFAHPDYVRLFAQRDDRVLAAAASDGRSAVLYPFIRRGLRTLPWFGPGDEPLADLTTPYGYGGAFTWNEPPAAEFVAAFWSQFGDWARGNRAVTEFVRFSLFSDDLLPYPGEIQTRALNVVRSLTVDDNAMWMDFKHKVRKNIKKAQRSNVEVRLDPDGRWLDDFLRIYAGTMDRRGSSKNYYFPREFFESIHDRLPGQFIYFHAVCENRIVSTEMVLVSAESVYSFLGGTDETAFDLRPNDLLKYEIIRWARDEGKRQFVLGGGYEPEDGIYQYKLSFAPGGVVPFRTGQRVLDDPACRRLLERREDFERSQGTTWSPRRAFFPPYRA